MTTTATPTETWLSVAQVSRIMKISQSKVHDLIEKGFLKAADISVAVGRRQFRIAPEDLEACKDRLASRPPLDFRRAVNMAVSPVVARLLAEQ